jgi:hypothetical protein
MLPVYFNFFFLYWTFTARQECSSYTWLVNKDRNINYSSGVNTWLCDRSISSGWYRFGGDAGTQMSTTCVRGTTYSNLKCRTHGVSWLNGTHPSVAEEKVTRQVCFSYGGTCCWSPKHIEVINCGFFYIYKLVPVTWCESRYCGIDVWYAKRIAISTIFS